MTTLSAFLRWPLRRKVRFLGAEGEEIAWFWRDRQITAWREWEWT